MGTGGRAVGLLFHPTLEALHSWLTLSEPRRPLPPGDHLGPTSWNGAGALYMVKPQPSACSQ